jgi:hypothetical protein
MHAAGHHFLNEKEDESLRFRWRQNFDQRESDSPQSVPCTVSSSSSKELGSVWVGAKAFLSAAFVRKCVPHASAAGSRSRQELLKAV